MRNIFAVLTYRCNAKCSFCLYYKDPIQDCLEEDFLDTVKYAFEINNQPVKLKITGGEPLIRPKLLEGVINIANESQSDIRMIGIGTNGFKKLPSFLNNSKHKIYVYLSRHQIGQEAAKEFGFKKIPDPKDIITEVDPKKVELRLSCTIMKKTIYNDDVLSKYIGWAYEQGIKHLCLRELNHLTLDGSPANYDMYIQDYLKTYKEDLVNLDTIENWLSKINGVKKIEGHQSSRSYIKNIHYQFNNDLVIQLRRIDEEGLLNFNKNNPDIIDEYVIHPDGLLTGCWDRSQKIIKRRCKNA